MDAEAGRVGLYVLAGIWLLPILLTREPHPQFRARSPWFWWFVLLLTSWLGWVLYALTAPRDPKRDDD